MRISKDILKRSYIVDRKSSAEIAKQFECSEHKINYWLAKYDIKKRNVSEAIYVKRNPNGDPFSIQEPKTIEEAKLFGLGIGLYWGEGTKRNKHTIRLGNTDPELIKKFIEFLITFFNIEQKKLRFGLQIFSDMDSQEALQFWRKKLGVSILQFQKVIVTETRGVGTYRHKTKHGVLTVYFNNKKLRDILCGMLK